MRLLGQKASRCSLACGEKGNNDSEAWPPPASLRLLGQKGNIRSPAGGANGNDSTEVVIPSSARCPENVSSCVSGSSAPSNEFTVIGLSEIVLVEPCRSMELPLPTLAIMGRVIIRRPSSESPSMKRARNSSSHDQPLRYKIPNTHAPMPEVP